MKMNKYILVSALISTLSLPALAASNVDQNQQMPMSRMTQDSEQTSGNATGKMPDSMPMNMQNHMKMGQKHGNTSAVTDHQKHSSSKDSQPGMQQGGMNMSMMKMMPQKMAEMKAHRERVETHLANIESSLQQLVELQKEK